MNARAAVAFVLALAASLGSLSTARSDARSSTPTPSELVLYADLDDDDADGMVDGRATQLSTRARTDLTALAGAFAGKRLALGGDVARVVLQGRPLALPTNVPAGSELQGLRAGHGTLFVGEGRDLREIPLRVVAFTFEDARAVELDSGKTHLTFSRAFPEASPLADPDGFRVVVRGMTAYPTVDVVSLGAKGRVLDAVRGVPVDAPCDGAPATRAVEEKAAPVEPCARSRSLRLVVDHIDRDHQGSLGRSLLAEVGGLVVVAEGGKKRTSIHVGGPRDTRHGPMPRFRLHLKSTMFRAEKTGKPALFANEGAALESMRADFDDAASLWAQCGIAFADPDMRIAPPPPPFLVSFGNDLGLPSSGGVVSVKVEGKKLKLVLPPGRTPLDAARLFAIELEKAGFRGEVSRNARIAPGAFGSADVRVSKADGALARVEAEGLLSSDASMNVAIGEVDLSDGLTHFGDMDSPAGTLEERALVKSLDDSDPRILRVLYVPYFAGGGRVGESFIYGDGSSVKNVVLLDRSGIRTRRSSHAVAHELGHALLDVPGHPDDFGTDTPSLLMDSDASDASVYGPRRLTVDECARVLVESGPRGKIPLLEAWPFEPVPLPALAP